MAGGTETGKTALTVRGYGKVIFRNTCIQKTSDSGADANLIGDFFPGIDVLIASKIYTSAFSGKAYSSLKQMGVAVNMSRKKLGNRNFCLMDNPLDQIKMTGRRRPGEYLKFRLFRTACPRLWHLQPDGQILHKMAERSGDQK